MLEADELGPWTLYQEGRHAECLEALEASLAEHPSELGLLLLRAQCHQALGDLDEALEDFTAILAADDTSPRTWYARAACHLQASQPQAALDDTLEALRRTTAQPEFVGTLYATLSSCLSYLGRGHEAIEAATLALRACPEQRAYRVGRAAAWSRLARGSAGTTARRAAEAALCDYDAAAALEDLGESERLDYGVLALHVERFEAAREAVSPLTESETAELAAQARVLLAEIQRVQSEDATKEAAAGQGSNPDLVLTPLALALERWFGRQGVASAEAAKAPVGAYAFHVLADWEFSSTQGMRLIAVPEVGCVLVVLRDDAQAPFPPLVLLPKEMEALLDALEEIAVAAAALGEGESLRRVPLGPRRLLLSVEGTRQDGVARVGLLARSRSSVGAPETVASPTRGAALRLNWPVERTQADEMVEAFAAVREHARQGQAPLEVSYAAWSDGVLDAHYLGQPAAFVAGLSFDTDLTDNRGAVLSPYELVPGEPLAIYAVRDSGSALPLAMRVVRLTPPHQPPLTPAMRLLRDATSPLENFADLCELGERADLAVCEARWEEAVASYETLRVALSPSPSEGLISDTPKAEPSVVEPFLAAKLTLGTLWLAVQQDDLQAAANLLGATWGVYGAGVKSLREGALSATDTLLFMLVCARLCALHEPAGEKVEQLVETLQTALVHTQERNLQVLILTNWFAHLREMAGPEIPQDWLDTWLAARDEAGLSDVLATVVEQVRFVAPDRWIKRLQTM